MDAQVRPAERLAGAYLYYDARADDARLTLTIARTAALDFEPWFRNGTSFAPDRPNTSIAIAVFWVPSGMLAM